MQRSRAPRKLDCDGLWDYALRILSQRSKSTSELRQKLSSRADSPASVTAVLAKLREYGFADDAKFSEAFAAARVRNQGFGRMRILRDLRGKRVAPAVAEQATAKAFSGLDELALARQYLERKYRGKDLRELFRDEKQLAGAYRRLRTAGFTGRASVDLLRTYSARSGELEDTPEEE